MTQSRDLLFTLLWVALFSLLALALASIMLTRITIESFKTLWQNAKARLSQWIKS